jgi:excisionase family DNA binding protein
LTDFSEELNISASQTYALVRIGELPAIQIGGRNQWRVERSTFEEYIQEAHRRVGDNLNSRPVEPPEES